MNYLQFSNKKYKNKRIILDIGNDAPIDPEETKKKVKPLFEQTKEFKKQQELAVKKGALTTEQMAINYKFRTAKNKDELRLRYAQINVELKALEKEIIENAKNFNEAYRNLFRKNAVYSTPRNAKLLSEKETQLWVVRFQKLKNEILLEDGSKITKKELERERVSHLSIEDKMKEVKTRLAEKTGQAIQMRNSLEIQGDEKALEKSQKWFESEKAKIEELYS